MKTYEKEVNILIVDDTPEHISMACKILEPLGYPIRVAANGASALRLIAERKPTLLLLDVQMEGFSGFDVCSHLKQSPEYEDIAIIFMTASSDAGDIQKGFSLGAQDYVVKPYHASELLARVLAHIRLSVQACALKASYQELDNFTHAISHDLKSPLQVIRQLTGLLESELSDQASAEAMEILNRIDLKSAQLISMVERLLAFSKVGIQECHFEQVDLNKLFTRQIQEQSSLDPHRRITVCQDSLPTVTGDPALLELLVQNLVNNALKFSSRQEETVLTITSRISSKEAEIRLKDNGAGFDMEYASGLFKVFGRLHGASEFEGSGVGLSICRRIMERHGGTIQIQARAEQGALVILTFPYKI